MICEIENRLKDIIVSCVEDINFSDINENTDLVRDYNFNSINIIHLVVEIEHAFDIEIDDEDLLLEKLSPFINLIKILRKKLDKNKEPKDA